MNYKLFESLLESTGYAFTPVNDGGLYRPDGKLLVSDGVLTMSDGNTIQINAAECNANTYRYSNDPSQTNNQQEEGSKLLTPLQCVQAWYIARDTLKVCGGSYTPPEKIELLRTILRANGHNPDIELKKMADNPSLMASAKTINAGTIVMDMNVNKFLGTAACIGKFLGKVGAYILVGLVWVFKALVTLVKALWDGNQVMLVSAHREGMSILTEKVAKKQ